MRHKIDFFEVVSGLFLGLLLVLVTLIAAQGDYQIFLVLAGFLPTILLISLSMTIHEQYAKHKSWLWLLPIVINFIFYFIGSTTPVIYNQFDVNTLIGANLMLSIIYVIVVAAVFLDDFKKQVEKKEKKHIASPQSLQDIINSIEDKSKALNFVIGRVYSKYHGGSRDLRAKLHIPSDWYNEFSLIGVGTDNIDTKKLVELIDRFENQLELLLKSEKEVIGYECDNLKNLIRDNKGRDTIIDVLDKNDKDPARSYFEGAVSFCKQIKTEIKENRLNIVKNAYVPTEEELEELKEKNTPQKDVSTVIEKKHPKHP